MLDATTFKGIIARDLIGIMAQTPQAFRVGTLTFPHN
jgi:hypothetical protein